MPSKSTPRKSVTRRSFLSIAGATTGAAALGKFVSFEVKSLGGVLSPTSAPASPPLAAASVAAASSAPAKAPAAAPVAIAENTLAPLTPAGAAELSMFAPLKAGSKVFGWKIVNIHGVRMGAVPVVMENKQGQRFQVDVCVRDSFPGAPVSVADTDRLSFFLANEGSGATPSKESHGLGAVALAESMARKSGSRLAPGLLTLRQRLAAYPDGELTVRV